MGYFRREFVERRRWLDEAAYADIVALCQFLPGPASSQVGLAIGLMRAGFGGAACAWIGFTLPSALALTLFAIGLGRLGDPAAAGWLHGLKIVAAAVVAQAVWGMARSLCPDRPRASLAIGAALLALALPTSFGQVGALAAAGLIGWRFLPAETGPPKPPLGIPVTRPAALCCLAGFAILLLGLPVAVSLTGDPAIRLVDAFYRAGALVFGGGHVVLPLLQAGVVAPGWVENETFLAGYGAAQAVPGPLFTFASFLGASMGPAPNGIEGSALALLAIFLPSFLLVPGALPFWDALRTRAAAQSALRGINAAVVGLLLAALYTPVWTSAILSPIDFGLGLAAFAALTFWACPPWLVVGAGALAGALLR